MARTQQVFNSFSAGVLSPNVTLRSDLEKYQSALQECVNWIITPQGTLRMREGFKNFPDSISSTPNDDSRIFQFHGGGDESDIVVDVTFPDSSVHYRVDGVLLPDVTAHEFPVDTIEDLYFTNRADTAVITHQTRPPYIIKQDYLDAITGEHINFNQIPWVLYNDGKSPSEIDYGQPRTWTMTFSTTSGTWKQGDPYWIRYGPGSEVNEPMDAYWFDTVEQNVNTIIYVLKTNVYLSSPETEITVTSADNLVFTVSIVGKGNAYSMRTGYTFKEGSEVTRDVDTVDNFDPLQTAKEPAWSYPYTVLHVANYYKCLQSHFSETATTEPGVGTDWTDYWEDLGTTKPDYFDWQYPDGLTWAADTYYAPWDRGFPALSIFHQQRLLFMNTPDAGTGLWGSALGDYSNFTLGADDDEAFYFDIDTSDTPDIRWAAAQRSLIMGTSGGDYAVGAEVTLSPSDIQAEKQNNARSHGTNAITINTDIFYIEQGKEKVRSTGYNDDVKSQTSQEVSLIAEHLLHARVKRLTLLQTPQVMMVGLRDDGTLVAFSYSHELGTGAWFEFETAARVIDICAAYSILEDEDELWALVTYNGTDRYIEKMPYPKRVFTAHTTPTDDTLLDQGIVCLDGWTSGEMTTGDQNVIQGLDQYEGLEVVCLVDDAYAGTYTVTDGAIILETEESDQNHEGQWVIGSAYTATAKTFEIVSGNQRGTGFGTQRNWNRLFTRLHDSALPIINWQLVEDRTPQTLMGIAETVRMGTQDIEVMNLDFGDGSISIVQDRPYPTHVLGCFGEFDSNNG